MIGNVLELVRTRLSEHLLAAGGTPEGDPVQYPREFKEPIEFEPEAINLLLVNVEEERTMRPNDPYRMDVPGGPAQFAQPRLRLNLHLLFVANHRWYPEAWNRLSAIIQFFQTHPVLEFPAIDPTDLAAGRVERLVFELQTLAFAEQNEVWNALRSAHHPSVMYRAKLLLMRDTSPTVLSEVASITTDVNHRDAS